MAEADRSLNNRGAPGENILHLKASNLLYKELHLRLHRDPGYNVRTVTLEENCSLSWVGV